MEQLAASATAQGSYFMQKAGGGKGGGEKGGGGGGGKATLWQSAKRATQIIAYARHRRAKAAFNPLRAAARCPGAGRGARGSPRHLPPPSPCNTSKARLALYGGINPCARQCSREVPAPVAGCVAGLSNHFAGGKKWDGEGKKKKKKNPTQPQTYIV